MSDANDREVAAKPNIFIARQPIFRRNQRVFAYELLFRAGQQNFFDPLQDGEEATSRVLTNSYLLIGLGKLTGGKKAFINFTEDMLLNGVPALFSKATTVVEILETVAVTQEVVTACQKLAKRGYVLALDDFFYEKKFLPLLELAKIIKFDIRLMGIDELRRQVEVVARPELKLLAEKIETAEEFELTKEMGFDLFQGYFFSRPNIVEGRDIPGSKLQYLQILKHIQDENYDFGRLAELISRDVSLAYKLLKYVNSAYFARMQEIQAVPDAVVMLGEINIRKWLSLMMLSYMADDKPSELLRMATMRGCFCELIAQRLLRCPAESGKYHTVGMFSLLPALLDRPMAEVLHELPLAPVIKEVLLRKAVNPMRYTLALVRDYERGNWDSVLRLAKGLRIEATSLPVLYDEALDIVELFEFTD
ncbi:EAL and HDOD domain-containing protein [Thiovibrio sp. JS02]